MEYKVITYPALFGTLSTFKDSSTNLDVPFITPPDEVSVTNTEGEATNYYVYRSTNKLGAAMNIITT